jgi:hypothetical protein
MKVDTFTVGGETYKKSLVVKDNLHFGLRNTKLDKEVLEEEKQYGLVTYKRCGSTEFWMTFENDTRLLYE